MCKWNTKCEYKSDFNCHDCDYNYIKTEEELKEYLNFNNEGINMNNKELHIHLSESTLPSKFYTTLHETEKALNKEENIIHTTQTHVISTKWLVKGYRLFVYMVDSKKVELKLGKHGDFPEVRIAHNLEQMVLVGCFGKVEFND